VIPRIVQAAAGSYSLRQRAEDGMDPANMTLKSVTLKKLK